MTSQQMNVDTISNNLANVNTYGYKKERLEFKTLLYDTIKRAELDQANQTGRPVNLQLGLGVRPVATARIFTAGNWERTDVSQDFAIAGDGFFVVQRGEDDVKYTRDGSFKLSAMDEGLMLVTSEGFPVLSLDGDFIIIPYEVSFADVSVDSAGRFGYNDTEGQFQDLGMQFAIVQFSNVQGLEAVGSNLFAVTSASGQPLYEADGDVNRVSVIQQGVLESSNVQVAEEMVKLIIAQRAYDLNSKAIVTSDEMLQTANNLKR